MKVPVAFTLRNRAASLAQDARLLNGYAHIKRNRRDPKKIDSIHATKRPALTAAYTLTSGTGQALYVPATPTNDGIPATVVGDILYRSMTTVKKQLAFSVQPTNGNLNTAISPAITVNILDIFGNIVSATDNITLSLFDNATGATLGGTLTQAAIGGVATFNDITLDRSGSNFTLLATSGTLNSAISQPFTIPTHLVFSVQPVDTTPGTLFSVTVQSQDSLGAVDTRYSGFIDLSAYAGISFSSGPVVLNGNLSALAVNGSATFIGLSISQAAASVYLLAEGRPDAGLDCYTPANNVSNPFNIAQFALTISANTTNYNVYNQFVSAYGVPPANVNLLVTINSGVVVRALASGQTGLTWDNLWTGTPTFYLLNLGYVLGHGGEGGNGDSAGPSNDGVAGSDALSLSGQTVTISNSSGFIFGGGGGGGGGGSAGTPSDGFVPGGGGGGGAGNGAAGTRGFPSGSFGQQDGQAASATAGTVQAQTGGAGGAGGVFVPLGFSAGAGGAGGSYGQAGTTGSVGTPQYPSATPGNGAAAGKAISLSGGTATFVSGNDATHVKGSVS